VEEKEGENKAEREAGSETTTIDDDEEEEEELANSEHALRRAAAAADAQSMALVCSSCFEKERDSLLPSAKAKRGRLL